MIFRALFLVFWLVLPVGAWTGDVVAVTDGDTIKVSRAGKIYRIRLYGIDTPELNQAYGPEARNFAARIIAGRTVEIEEIAQDRYGRIVGIVSLGGNSLNEMLVKAGYAWVYDRYCRRKILCAELKRWEKEVRNARKGLFENENAVHPSVFRRNKK